MIKFSVAAFKILRDRNFLWSCAIAASFFAMFGSVSYLILLVVVGEKARKRHDFATPAYQINRVEKQIKELLWNLDNDSISLP